MMGAYASNWITLQIESFGRASTDQIELSRKINITKARQGEELNPQPPAQRLRSNAQHYLCMLPLDHAAAVKKTSIG